MLVKDGAQLVLMLNQAAVPAKQSTNRREQPPDGQHGCSESHMKTQTHSQIDADPSLSFMGPQDICLCPVHTNAVWVIDQGSSAEWSTMSPTEPVIWYRRLLRWQPLRRKEGASQRVQLSVGKACMAASSMRVASTECKGYQQLKLVAESTPVLPQWPSFHKLMR